MKDLLMAKDFPKRFYHVTRLRNRRSIELHGLRANDAGEIYVVTHPLLWAEIAANQIFSRTYAVFEIDAELLRGTVLRDDPVGELSRAWHRVIVHDLIPPRHLTLVHKGRLLTDIRYPIPWVYVWNWLVSRKTPDEVESIFRQLARARKEHLKREAG